MAVTGFKCESGADVFHAQQDVSRWLGARLGKRISTALKELELAKKQEKKAIKKVASFILQLTLYIQVFDYRKCLHKIRTL
jgi:hypothetical protein